MSSVASINISSVEDSISSGPIEAMSSAATHDISSAQERETQRVHRGHAEGTQRAK